MINNVCFQNQNSNNSTCSTASSQATNQHIYNSPYASLAGSGRQSVEQINGFNRRPMIGNSLTASNSNLINSQSIHDPQFALMSNSNTVFSTNAPPPQATNSANPLLSYSTHLSTDQTATANDLVRIQNECVSMSPTCSNTSTVSSNHTLPSFMDTYSSKLSATTTAEMNASLIDDEECKNVVSTLAPASLQNNTNQVLPQAARTMNGNLNSLNGNHNLDDNHFDSDDLLYEFESPLNQFDDDQSYSNSSFTSVDLPTPPPPAVTSAELVTMSNCQSNQLFNLSNTTNCSPGLMVNTPASTPLNGLLSNCSSPISSLQDNTFKPTKFKQEPGTMEYDCNNNNLTVLNQNQPQTCLPMNNNLIKQQSSIYSPAASLFGSKTAMNNVDTNSSMFYNDFNSFDLDLYAKNELTSTDEMNGCLNGGAQSIMNPQQDHSMQQQPPQSTFNNCANRMTAQQQLYTTSGRTTNTTLQPTNKKLNSSLLNVNQMNQPTKTTNLNVYSSPTNRLKYIRNQMISPDSSAYKTKQMNQFTQQLNSTKYGSNNAKTSLVCLVCGDQANCCHYKVVT